MEKNKSKICEYIHLPVQSGNSRVLQEMNRNYTREEYLEKIQMIRSILPHVVFSSDFIVGFPGETEVEFQDTLSLMEEVGYETIFAFKYSPRPFTKAAQFEDQIPEEIKSDRLARLLEIHDRISMKLVKKYEGQVCDVLVDHFDKEKGWLSGRSSHNKLVHFTGDPCLVGETVPVRVLKAFPSTFRGELIKTSFGDLSL